MLSDIASSLASMSLDNGGVNIPNVQKKYQLKDSDMRCMFKLIKERLQTPASTPANGIVEQVPSHIPTHITNTEVFAISVIEYFASSSFPIFLDKSLSFVVDGTNWRNVMAGNCNTAMFHFYVQKHDHSFEVGCCMFDMNAIISLTHARTRRSYHAEIPIGHLNRLREKLIENVERAETEFRAIVMQFLDPRFSSVFNAAFKNQLPPIIHLMEVSYNRE